MAVNAKAKIGLRSSIMVQNVDFYYPQNYCLSQNTFAKVQTLGSTVKKSKSKASKSKDSKLVDRKTLASSHINKPEKTSH